MKHAGDGVTAHQHSRAQVAALAQLTHHLQ
jgi:hypothetical protein